MYIKKHMLRSLLAIIIAGAFILLLAQPIITSNVESSYAITSNDGTSEDNFVTNNGTAFHSEVAQNMVIPLYIQFVQSYSNVEDYETLIEEELSTSKAVLMGIHDQISSQMDTFKNDYSNIHYYIMDNEEHVYKNNSSLEENALSKKVTNNINTWQIVFHYNDVGLLIVDAVSGNKALSDSEMSNEIDAQKSALTTIYEYNNSTSNSSSVFQSSAASDVTLKDIKNVTFVIEITSTMGLGTTETRSSIINSYVINSYVNSEGRALLTTIHFLMILCAILYIYKLPRFFQTKGYQLCMKLPIELFVVLYGIILIIAYSLDFEPVYYNYSSILYIPIIFACKFIVYALSFAGTLWACFFLYHCVKRGWNNTYQQQSIFFQRKGSLKAIYHHWIQTLGAIKDDTQKHNMWIIILWNTLALCFLWVLPMPFIILYGISLYFIWRKVIRSTQKDFSNLQSTIQQFSDGEYDIKVPELGRYDSLKEDLVTIQEGVSKAIAQEISSQRMKNELITNVSHDLKTPLTSIISYIDLLKDPTISKEEQDKYLSTLEKSADRLKHLIEDLFEISKANSGAVTIDMMEVDLISLLKQVEMECQHTYQRRHLIIKHHFSDEKILMRIDPQKAYRIFENLYSNAGKYALEKTRVFIQVTDFDSRIDVEIKNISKAEMNFTAEEIMERFTRGDKSRNTEGSGLGLAIAKSFTELMQGSMRIEIDGDVFKVTISFYKAQNSSKQQ